MPCPIQEHIEGFHITARWGSFPAALSTYVPWDPAQSVWVWRDEPEDMESAVIFTDRLTAHEVAGAIKAARPKFINDISVEAFAGDAYPGQVDDSESSAAPEVKRAVVVAAALYGQAAE